ncbi:ATP/GTP-binding protein [Pseudomonas sp.]|uniref:AAA family ATPase n=1 Tax=Pseudomonas sp. TaxID=306 RepID=UPI000E84A9A3|nr:ATP-binding protein [Pseudomonas sp.]HBP48654.1 ATPase [Pseudomonas sp.]
MINNFHISNFRHFEEVEIKNLNRVNLFVGKNSAGKSVLLEALLLFFTQMSPKYLPQIHNSRQEDWDSRDASVDRSPLRHFFKNHLLPEMGDPGFTLSSIGDPRSFEAIIAPYFIQRDGIVSTYTPIDDGTDDFDPEFIEPFLVLKKNDNLNRVVRLARYGGTRSRLASRVEPQDAAFFVSTKGVNDDETAKLWDAISLTDSEEDVISGLKLIEPGVEGVAFVGSDRGRVALVKLANHIEPVSLKSLGDGMSRVLQIVLSLVNAKNSVLLVDEFENGLHWGVQKAVWELVFKLATRLNVQVFATTHSRDCIKGFESAWAEYESAGSFARISKTSDNVSIKEYSFDLLKDSIETDVEVR